MLFVQSLRGLSHTKLEDTKEEHLELAVQALDRLASKTIDRASRGGRLEDSRTSTPRRRADEPPVPPMRPALTCFGSKPTHPKWSTTSGCERLARHDQRR